MGCASSNEVDTACAAAAPPLALAVVPPVVAVSADVPSGSANPLATSVLQPERLERLEPAEPRLHPGNVESDAHPRMLVEHMAGDEPSQPRSRDDVAALSDAPAPWVWPSAAMAISGESSAYFHDSADPRDPISLIQSPNGSSLRLGCNLAGAPDDRLDAWLSAAHQGR